jgi:hypothetical protein
VRSRCSGAAGDSSVVRAANHHELLGCTQALRLCFLARCLRLWVLFGCGGGKVRSRSTAERAKGQHCFETRSTGRPGTSQP